MGPWQKTEDLCPGKKFYNSKPTKVAEPEVLKNAKQCFFVPTASKKGQKNAKLWRTCQTMFFHAKQLQKRPNFWNLAIKMPTWQHWRTGRSGTAFSYYAISILSKAYYSVTTKSEERIFLQLYVQRDALVTESRKQRNLHGMADVGNRSICAHCMGQHLNLNRARHPPGKMTEKLFHSLVYLCLSVRSMTFLSALSLKKISFCNACHVAAVPLATTQMT